MATGGKPADTADLGDQPGGGACSHAVDEQSSG
jgi:hypothetical protein